MRADADRWNRGEQVLAQALGLFTIRFAQLESAMDSAIGRLLNTEPSLNDLLVAAVRNVSTRLDILAALVNEIAMPDEGRAKLRAAVEEIARLNTYRNRLVHNPWPVRFYEADRLVMAQKSWIETSRPKARRRFQDFTPEEMAENTEACTACSRLLAEGIEAYAVSVSKNKERPS